jgi:hypothetical protein
VWWPRADREIGGASTPSKSHGVTLSGGNTPT